MDGPSGARKKESLPGRAEFMRANADRMSAAQANAAYDKLLRARQASETLAELQRLCGADRVTYLECDVTSRADVLRTVERIRRDGARVELLLNVAGIVRTKALTQKTLAEFREARDLKLLAYANLCRAFVDDRPAMWCNFGSYAGFFGIPGETDYAAVNDLLFNAAWRAAADGHDEYTVGFGLWGEAGLAASGLWRSRFDNAGLLTPMPTAEGVERFMTELTTRTTATVQFGDVERHVIERAAPGYLAWCVDGDDPSAFFVDRMVERTDRALVAERTFDLERDGYLAQHVIGGYPTLPGSFYPEIAAQVALEICPGRVPVRFADLRLESFLRIYGEDRPHTVRIRAEQTEPDVVHVRVSHDVVAPNGQVLAADRLHAELDVWLQDEPVPPPAWSPDDETTASESGALVNPLYLETPAVQLGDLFRTTPAPEHGRHGVEAALELQEHEMRRWIPQMVTPMLTIEGTVQLLAAQPADGEKTVVVPRTIGLIELYDTVGRAATVLAPSGAGSMVALTADGLVALQIRDVTTVVVDRIT